MRGTRKKPIAGVAVLVSSLVVAALGAGLYWFQPWKLWVDQEVREEIPVAAAQPKDPPAGTAPSPAASSPEAGPSTVAVGELISHEHDTAGTVRILRLADGSHVLRLEGLRTSNGPDLRVWLTDAPVIQGKAGWGVFDDGRHVSLGGLKGNQGDHNYPLPADVDLADFSSVSIWCDRFDVSFGAAELTT